MLEATTQVRQHVVKSAFDLEALVSSICEERLRRSPSRTIVIKPSSQGSLRTNSQIFEATFLQHLLECCDNRLRAERVVVIVPDGRDPKLCGRLGETHGLSHSSLQIHEVGRGTSWRVQIPGMAYSLPLPEILLESCVYISIDGLAVSDHGRLLGSAYGQVNLLAKAERSAIRLYEDRIVRWLCRLIQPDVAIVWGQCRPQPLGVKGQEFVVLWGEDPDAIDSTAWNLRGQLQVPVFSPFLNEEVSLRWLKVQRLLGSTAVAGLKLARSVPVKVVPFLWRKLCRGMAPSK